MRFMKLLTVTSQHDSRHNSTTSNTRTHRFNGPFPGLPGVSQYQKGKTNLDFCEARDSEWQWHQLGHVQVRTSLQTDNYASTTPLSFLQAGCPSCRPNNSIKTLKAVSMTSKYGENTRISAFHTEKNKNSYNRQNIRIWNQPKAKFHILTQQQWLIIKSQC